MQGEWRRIGRRLGRGRPAGKNAESEHGRSDTGAPTPGAALGLRLISTNARPDVRLHLVEPGVQRFGAQGGEEGG